MAHNWVYNIGDHYVARQERYQKILIVSFIPVLTYAPVRAIPAVISPICKRVIDRTVEPWYIKRVNEHVASRGCIEMIDNYYRNGLIYMHFDVCRAEEEDIETLLDLIVEPDVERTHLITMAGRKLQLSARNIKSYVEQD